MALAKIWVVVGAFYAFLGVTLGAFGGHVLKQTLRPQNLSIYLIGVQYQMYHAFALILLGIWAAQNSEANTNLPGFAFSVGTIAFSGSLYALALTDIKILGMITPIGGLSFLVGWIGWVFVAWKV